MALLYIQYGKDMEGLLFKITMTYEEMLVKALKAFDIENDNLEIYAFFDPETNNIIKSVENLRNSQTLILFKKISDPIPNHPVRTLISALKC